MSKKICRLCLAHPSVGYSLLEKNISEMLEALTSIKVESNDKTSTISCVRCLLNVRIAFNIQQNIIKSGERLKKMSLLNKMEVKFEATDSRPVIFTPSIVNVEELDLCCSNCVICGINVENMTKHVQEHFSNKQSCDLCSRSFNNIDEYKQHFSKKRCKQIVCKCVKCGATFKYKSLYNVHMKQVHQEVTNKSRTEIKKLIQRKIAEGPFTCNVCQKQFAFKKQFKCHTHAKGKCPICNAEISKSNLKKHLDNHSSGPQICELCGATLKSLESLRGHMTHTHSTRRFTCEECGKVFAKRYTYMLHKKKHNGDKPHVCDSCGKSFYTFHYLTKHINTTHLKLRPFICEYCNKAFSSKHAVRTHTRQHTNETPYKCEVCGDGFRQNVSLKAHRKSRHNIVEAETCPCRVCGKKFASEQAVISHMRLH